MSSKGHFINGAWDHSGHGMFYSANPATGEVLWEGPEASGPEIDAAVRAAQQAFVAWSKTNFDERLVYIEAFKAVAERRQGELAEAISKEMGKVRWEAEAEAKGVIGKVDISIKSYHERTPTHTIPGSGLTNHLTHRPHGVMAVYGPYNFPAHLPNGHMVPALLAGNVVILKPSEITPLVGQVLVECWQEAGIPAGVVQLVQGAKNTGIVLSGHEGLSGVLFTGSVATGTALHKQCAGQLDRMLALELGGHNPLVVWDTENIDAAVELIIQSAFITTGQRCTCARRLILQNNSASETLLARLVQRAASLTHGPWDDAAAFMGPLASKQAADGSLKAYQQLVANGARPLLEMTQPGGTAFVTPGMVDVTGVVGVPDEEVFAPLLKVTLVDSFDAAIAEANNTRYGLSAGLLSDNKAHVEQFMRDIRAGVVAINRPTTGASGAMPFGGIGISGNHRPAAFYAADYCAYPMAVQMSETVEMPTSMPAGSAGTK